MTSYKQIKTDLKMHWLIFYIMLAMLVFYNVICHTVGPELQIQMEEQQRVFIRSILYAISIALFPLSNLLRHILLRLNQTMPGDNPAKNRYLMTTVITLASIEIVGVFGLVMFLLGDHYNTLYIFTTLGGLGLFLHRPREQEYRQIIEVLEKKS